MSVKEQVLEAIQRLPEDIDFRDVTDEIALLSAVHEAELDIQQGRVISNAEMKSRIAQLVCALQVRSRPPVLG